MTLTTVNNMNGSSGTLVDRVLSPVLGAALAAGHFLQHGKLELGRAEFGRGQRRGEMTHRGRNGPRSHEGHIGQCGNLDDTLGTDQKGTGARERTMNARVSADHRALRHEPLAAGHKVRLAYVFGERLTRRKEHVVGQVGRKVAHDHLEFLVECSRGHGRQGAHKMIR